MDRVVQGYVVDFISVRIFNVYDFPVFNFADIYVTFAVIVYLISVLKYERS
ncbi:MAG: signal peptidase II [Ezakiella sp.]